MPHVVVYNLLKSDFESERIEAIEGDLTIAILGIKELELSPDDISFSFPYDPKITSGDIPVVIIVELLFDLPERTKTIRQRLAIQLGRAFKSTVTMWRKLAKLEVAVKRFDPVKDGFYSCE